jgi:hypothetical protein
VSAAMDALRRYLRMTVEATPVARMSFGWHYLGPADFVLREGQQFEPRERPESIDAGAARMCFGNSIATAIRYGLPYVEGYAVGPKVAIGVSHAWNLDAEGRVVDTTWPEPGQAYLGVRFSVARAHDATWNGDACVLDDWKRGYPLMREPWTPEESPGEFDLEAMAADMERDGFENAGAMLRLTFALRGEAS